MRAVNGDKGKQVPPADKTPSSFEPIGDAAKRVLARLAAAHGK